ncbi:MAG: hypothetical protein GY822_19145 [Deltaproteobacteria bacterium]|nr:hypothetical protein [Deltaproteobacteria bacterium]
MFIQTVAKSTLLSLFLTALTVALLCTGCPDIPTEDPNDAGPSEPDAVVFGQTLGLDACDEETIAAYPDHRCFGQRQL